jgi:phosphoribosylglycinamide formyltransferase-1
MVLKLAVLISGRGSNLAAIQHAIEAGRCAAQIQLVVSDRSSAAGLGFASEHGLRTAVCSMKDHTDRSAWDRALTDLVAEGEPDLIVLAGFMRLVGPAFLARFSRRVINVHPALLPLFPGTDGPEQALAAGVRISGCTVHLVDAGIDTGQIIAQAAVAVLQDDDVATLHARIQLAEHTLLPGVIHALSGGTIVLEPELRISSGLPQSVRFLSPPLADGPA